MGNYSIQIKSPYDTKTYNDIKNTYLWVINICELLGIDEAEISSSFHYRIGEIICESNSFEEFTENAFGQKIVLIVAKVYTQKQLNLYFSISAKYFLNVKNIYISCNSKSEIGTILDKIKEIDRAKKTRFYTFSTQSFWKGILQNIISNILWWIIGAILITIGVLSR